MCIKKFDADFFFLSNLQGFQLSTWSSSKSYLLQRKTGKGGKVFLPCHLWCPDDLQG